ncbi:MAG TPA: GNVR domain-containing protein [Terriglobales bacterium]|nr:GNVR domain-containing protein [Terriglobales bacterium]
MEIENGDIFVEDVESRNGQSQSPGVGHSGPSFFDVVLETAAQNRRTLAWAFVLALVASTVVAFVIPKRYESTTRIMPPEGPNPAALLAAATGKIPAGLADLAGGMLGVKNTGPLWIELLQSRTILDHQIDHYDLMKAYRKRYREGARKKLSSRTDLSEDRKSGVIKITVTDTDRSRAQGLANGYIDELNTLLANVSTSAARRERVFIEQRLNQSKKDLETAEVQFGQFASKNSTFDLKEQTRAIVGAGAQLEGQIIAAQSELEALQQTYTDDNIRVRTVKARIASLKRDLAKIGGPAGGVGIQGGENGDVSPVPLAPGDISPSIRELPILGVQWADLYRRAKVQETVFELLTQQYELAKIQEAKEIPTVKVIDTADYPEKKSWPPRLLIILLTPFLAVGGVIGWFRLRDAWNTLPTDNPTKVRTSKFIALFRNQNPASPHSSE